MPAKKGKQPDEKFLLWLTSNCLIRMGFLGKSSSSNPLNRRI